MNVSDSTQVKTDTIPVKKLAEPEKKDKGFVNTVFETVLNTPKTTVELKKDPKQIYEDSSIVSFSKFVFDVVKSFFEKPKEIIIDAPSNEKPKENTEKV